MQEIKDLKKEIGYPICEIEDQIIAIINDYDFRKELDDLTKKLPPEFVIEGVVRINKNIAYVLIGKR